MQITRDSLTHWHGLAGHDVVSGWHLPLPILWGAPQCGLQRPPWYGTMADLSHIDMVSLDMMKCPARSSAYGQTTTWLEATLTANCPGVPTMEATLLSVHPRRCTEPRTLNNQGSRYVPSCDGLFSPTRSQTCCCIY